MSSAPRNIHVLGGGSATLAAVYRLTERPGWWNDYRITVYQQGWRLGGKAATSRDARGRILDHGFHALMEFYERTWKLLEDCYEDLKNLGTPMPYARPEDAFHPVKQLLFPYQGQYWVYDVDDLWPSPQPEPQRARTLNDDVRRLLEVMVGNTKALGPVGAPRELIEELLLREELISQETKERVTVFRDAVAALGGFVGDAERRRVIIEFAAALAIGLISRALHAAAKFQSFRLPMLDDVDFREFLRQQHARPEVYDSVLVGGSYDITFSPPGGLGAGVAVAGALGLIRAKRYLCTIPKDGLGEAMISPLYRVLKHRGVEFQFFTAVDRLEASGERVSKLHVWRQAVLRGDYEPLLPNAGWPARPNYWHPITNQEQVQGASSLDGVADWTFESKDAWKTQWPDARQETLTVGPNDLVLLGIGLGSLHDVLRDLDDPALRRMLSEVRTIRTYSSQFWFEDATGPQPWKDAVIGRCEPPYETWVDMTRQTLAEPPGPATLVYLCGSDAQASGPGPQTPAAAAEQANAWMQRNEGLIWPGAPHRRVAEHHHFSDLPSDLYVRGEPNSTAARLEPGGSRYRNLVLAGDWTLTSINCGCMESAVESGEKAAETIDEKLGI